MIVLKILGSLMIIISSSLIGRALADRFSKRYKNLVVFQNCINILETEIIYSATPLPIALDNVYKKGNKKVSFIFKKIKEHLIANRHHSVLDSFISVTSIMKEQLYFNDEDIEIILSLGRVLGESNRHDQEKHFKTLYAQLKTQGHDAEVQRSKNEKMYKSLGVLTGLAITIILL